MVPCKDVISTLRSTSHDALCWGNTCCERADPNNKIYKNNCDVLFLWSTNSEMIDVDKLLQWRTLRGISLQLLWTHGRIRTLALRRIRCQCCVFPLQVFFSCFLQVYVPQVSKRPLLLDNHVNIFKTAIKHQICHWLGFHQHFLMHILKYRMRNEWWKCQISNKNPLIHKTFLCLLEVGFDLCEKGLMRINGDGNAFCE